MNAVSENTGLQFGIENICVRFGRESVELDWLQKNNLLSAEHIAGIRQNGSSAYFRSSNHSAEMLAIEAVSGLLEQSGTPPEDIRFLIFTSTIFETTALYPDLVAQRIADATNCTNAKAFSLQHVYCVSPLAAMRLLQSYFAQTSSAMRAIIVSADSMGGVTEHLRAIDSSGVHSDGAVAILITNTGAAHTICDVDHFTNVSKFLGREADGLLVSNTMYFAMITKLIRNLISRNKISEASKIDLFVNNLDFQAWQGIGKILNIPENRIHFNKTCGHVFGADPFINLKNAGECDIDYCVLAATAVAGTVGAALLRKNQNV